MIYNILVAAGAVPNDPSWEALALCVTATCEEVGAQGWSLLVRGTEPVLGIDAAIREVVYLARYNVR